MTTYPSTLPEIFNLGMKRSVMEPLVPCGPVTLELGPGHTPMGCTHELDRMFGFDLNTDTMPHKEASSSI
jgi:hypothetical protein